MRARRHQHRNERGERGAVLAEFSIVAPLLILMVFMGLELGLLLRDEMTVSAAARAGARAGSSAQTTRLADYDVLQAVATALGPVDPADVESIVVFEPDVNGNVPPGCLTASVRGTCNRYTGADLARPVAHFRGTTSCTRASPDRAWCPPRRNRDQASPAGPDWLGVYVRIRHDSTIPGFLDSSVITDKTVMRLEPRLRS